MRSVVITGASTGIGWATAKLLLERGFRVFGSVRYEITPDPMRHLITGILPKRVVDRIIARRLGLLPPA